MRQGLLFEKKKKKKKYRGEREVILGYIRTSKPRGVQIAVKTDWNE